MQAGGKTAYYTYLSSSVTNDVRLYGFIQQYKNVNWKTVHSISNLSSSGYAYVDGSMAVSVTWISQYEKY